MTHADSVEQWDFIEIALEGPRDGNPFVDVELAGAFAHRGRRVTASGFYDGDGVYRLRFMPDAAGRWSFSTASNRAELDGATGSFECAPPSPGNCGPVRVADQFHFAHADGTRFVPVGTTCYAWTHQTAELEEQTLAALAASPFNKLRMCVFPKHYRFNEDEPERYPFEGTPKRDWDFTRFNPAFFRHLEGRTGDLRRLGIEADVILFHPYDAWGFSEMPADADGRCLRYVVARLAAYRNVWWSMANEYDLMKSKTVADWERLFQVVQKSDPHGHLRSIHNGPIVYDHTKPWVTHCSIQRHDVGRVFEWREQYGKPVVVDECGYEGDLPYGWGNLTALELVHRFWEGFARGAYVGHGETYLDSGDRLWWSKGGMLRGESPERIAFLRRIIEDVPAGLAPLHVPGALAANCRQDYYLYYWGHTQSAYCEIDLPEGVEYAGDIIDVWAMTVTPIPAAVTGPGRIDLPARPYHALRLRRT